MSDKSKAEILLREHEDDILWIKKRFYFLEKFVEVLEERSHGGRFEIANDTVYQMVHDCYDMLAIDLASLCRGMVQGGGFFNKLNNHLSEMKLAKGKDVSVPKGNVIYAGHEPSEAERVQIEESIRQDFVEFYLKNNASAFYTLFPLAKDRNDKRITQEDVKHLKDRFFNMAEGLIQDRDGNRAHRFENRRKNRASDVPKLSIQKIGYVFTEIESILNDIRLITNHSTFGYNNMNNCSVEETSKDLIDLIFLGTSVQVNHHFGVTKRLQATGNPYYWKLRDAFYENLHRYYETVHADMSKKIVEDYRSHGNYDKIKVPALPINKYKPKP